ncbi:hypothetical protein CPTMiller_0029 [Citrobacter phage Miller]|jgi:hypothetical protein|uniref:Uncharacterized protein n=2 Tax=Pseudotevenvirus TaxID=2842979 RepID=A0A076YKT7_9CAUD|nr:hypothetical protein CPTMiller_0029 [Citrobacter phage Miller]AIK67965.1 hypothetical protein CPTMiller_0029 [Citrobacter phage Miller]CCK73877.1 protein of unknown function [Pseudotevenvirus RB43]CCL97494.1 protein of unknown function [Pseudotevenvirus RB43]
MLKQPNEFVKLPLKRIEERIVNARDFVNRHPNMGAAKSYLDRLLEARATKIGIKR